MTGDTDTTVDDLMLVEAVAEGLHDEMARDESVVVLGEDVGQSGGVFRTTEGLVESLGGPEDPAGLADILAEYDHGLVAGHLVV